MEGTNTNQNQTEQFTGDFRGKHFYRGRGRGRYNKNVQFKLFKVRIHIIITVLIEIITIINRISK